MSSHGRVSVVQGWIVNETSLLWVRKMLTLFRIFDTEKKGWVTREELGRTVGERAVKIYTSEQLEKFSILDQKLWELLWAPAVEKVEGKEVITWRRFIEARVGAVVERKAEDRAAVRDIIKTIFQSADIKMDGQLGKQEYSMSVVVYGFSEHQTNIAFAAMDANADGTVSYEEAESCFIKFYHSFDWDNGTLNFGLLDPTHIIAEEDIRMS